jgi:hypothetical protein
LTLLNQEFVTAPPSNSAFPSLWDDDLADGLFRRAEREIGIAGVERGLRAGDKIVGFGWFEDLEAL